MVISGVALIKIYTLRHHSSFLSSESIESATS